MRMADGMAEEGAFSANFTHFWHFSTLMKILFIPHSDEKSKRFIATISSYKENLSSHDEKVRGHRVLLSAFVSGQIRVSGKNHLNKKQKRGAASSYWFCKTDVTFL